jgi:hypothetical protein
MKIRLIFVNLCFGKIIQRKNEKKQRNNLKKQRVFAQKTKEKIG